MPLVQSWQRQVGIGKESVWGTAVVPTDSIPFNTPTFEDKVAEVVDTGYRGDASKDQGYYQGSLHSEFSGEVPGLYADSAGHFLMGVLGADTVTGAGPYAHALKLAAGLPPSYTWTDYTGATATGQARSYAGHYFSDVTLHYTAANELLKVSPKSIGKYSVPVAKPTASYTTQAPFIGWQAALTLNTVANARLVSCSIDMKRPVEMVKGSGGTQQPDFGSIGQIEVTGKMVLSVVDETDLLLMLNNTQPVTSLVFTSGANILTATMSKTAFSAAVVSSGKDYFTLDATFRAIKNTTDSGPIQFALTNSRAAAY